MGDEKNVFWRLPKAEQRLMWVIGILVTIIIFTFAKQTVSSDVRANTTRINAQEIRYEQTVGDIAEIKQLIKELDLKFDKYIIP